jgi:hypothetical protein
MWGAVHPVLAVELMSAFVGVGSAVDNWDDFIQILQDPKETAFLLATIVMELMHLHLARTPGRRPPTGTGADTTRQPTSRAFRACRIVGSPRQGALAVHFSMGGRHQRSRRHPRA